jgi:histidinol-phosphatase (PHP family)
VLRLSHVGSPSAPLKPLSGCSERTQQARHDYHTIHRARAHRGGRHSSRFIQFDALVRGWWEEDLSPARRAETRTSRDEELGADLDQYVETVLAANAAGLPVVVGLEVDYLPGQMTKVAELLAGYPFDVLLGSVHWIGAWLFDALDWEQAQQQWASRGVEC